MSRATVILVAVLVLIVGGVVALASVDTAVAPTTVTKAMLNEAQPR